MWVGTYAKLIVALRQTPAGRNDARRLANRVRRGHIPVMTSHTVRSCCHTAGTLVACAVCQNSSRFFSSIFVIFAWRSALGLHKRDRVADGGRGRRVRGGSAARPRCRAGALDPGLFGSGAATAEEAQPICGGRRRGSRGDQVKVVYPRIPPRFGRCGIYGYR